jgi:hypothetical protein
LLLLLVQLSLSHRHAAWYLAAVRRNGTRVEMHRRRRSELGLRRLEAGN